MKVLSLFDGMACGMLAMQRSEITVDRYVAYEIDQYAVKTSTHNFPMIEHRGDVFHADFTEFRGFDFLIGGSPCTYWSIAQNKNRETEASGMGWELFSQYVRALHEARPKFFVYENNKSMSNAIRESITEAFGFEPICIDSALVSAQNRKRLYWVGKRNEDGTYSKVDIEQPEDRGILIRDILESGVCWREKTYTIDSNYYKTLGQQGFERQSGRRKMVAEPICVGVGYRNRREADGKLYRRFETHGQEKSNALTTVQTDSMVALEVDSKFADMPSYEVFNGEVEIKGKKYPIKLPDGLYIFRKFTVRECMRLQTVPEWYEFPVSNTQAYKMLGNGWTVDVIAHIFTYISKHEKEKKHGTKNQTGFIS